MQMPKGPLCSALLMCALCALSCGPLNIFDADEAPENNGKITTGELLSFRTGGGFAAVNQMFTVDSSGNAQLTGYVQNVLYRCLTSAELDTLVTLFTRNDFFQLADSYLSNAVDVVIYEICFSAYGMVKRVSADDLGAPESLQSIIKGVRAMTASLLERGPLLTLELDRACMMSGDTLCMKLTVSNITSEKMPLEFHSSQMYDFNVIQYDETTCRETVVWNWAHDRFFLQVLISLDLQPNESRLYEEVWTGVNNEGVQIYGPVLISAQLPAHPGGTAVAQYFEIIP